MDSTAAAAPALHLSKVSLVILYVRDPVKALAFYRDVLGMKVLEASPHWVELDAGGLHLALHPHPNVPAKRDDASSWVVFSVDDVHAAHAALKARGVAFLTEPKEVCGDETTVGLSADLEDLDGNRLSLFAMEPRKR